MKKNLRDGFSLVELIIVIAIMAIMVGLVALAITHYLEDAREGKCITERDTLSRDYLFKLATDSDGSEAGRVALVDQIMTNYKLTKKDDLTYSGLCESDGVYTVTIDKDTGLIKKIYCSVHGDNDKNLVVSEDPADYLKILRETFASYLETNAAKLGGSYSMDSNGCLYTPELTNKFMESLRAQGYKISDTAMWRIKYVKGKGYSVSWVDTGSKITAPGKVDKSTGKANAVMVNLDGTTESKTFDATIDYITVNRDTGVEKYLIIKNDIF